MESSSRLEVQLPRGRRSITVDDVQADHALTELLRHADLPLNTRCGQQGQCDGCQVELLRGTLARVGSQSSLRAEGPPHTVRGCEYRLPPGTVAEIRIPARSLLAHQPQVVTSFRINIPRAHDPLWQRLRVRASELPAEVPVAEGVRNLVARQHPTKPLLPDEEGLADPPRIERGVISIALEHRAAGWALRWADDHRQMAVYGAAVDIGTTTVVVLLVDLMTGDVVGEASSLNAQSDLGDNVLTRINRCMNDPEMVAVLQEAVVQKTILPLLQQTMQESGTAPHQLVCVSVAGNTTMLHLLAGVDPTTMGFAPFTPAFLDHRVISTAELPWTSAETADSGADPPATPREGAVPETPVSSVHLLPGAAAYVGADVVAGVLSSGMAYSSDTCMLVDVGTNGEIVLKHKDQLLGCATAAGPAFEGSGLRCGVRAGKGAIGHVGLEGDPPRSEVEVIGGGKPIGICGTAYVDFVAQARRIGLIGATGRYAVESTDEGPVQDTPHGRAFTMAHGRGKEPILVSEGDIASLLQAKAAIAAGMVRLLNRMGLTTEDVQTLFLAGGFGFHMNVENAIGFGLLPGFRPSQVQLVGNTSLAGAYLTLMDSGVLDEMKRVASRLVTIELNLDPEFESQYVEQLALPDPGLP